MAEKTAFIGVGNMGGPMAANLAEAGYDVVVFDLSTKACDDAKARGLAPLVGGAAARARDSRNAEFGRH